MRISLLFLLVCSTLILSAQTPSAVPPPAGAAPLPTAEILAGVIRAVEDNYVFPDIGRQLGADLRAKQQTGAYRNFTAAEELAKQLTADLQAISHDKHMRVRPVPPKSAGAPLMSREAGEKDNFGFVRVEILPGNIGYVDIRLFYSISLARDTVARAMKQIADTRAVIFDLRQHRGGDPGTVAFLCSYLLGPERVHLNDIYARNATTPASFYTNPEVPGRRYGTDKPVYLLTSKATFSAAEEFAYDLQSQKRATLYGETTGGGANPGGALPLPAGLQVFVPFGRASNPVTQTNWEGVGVKPEVPLPATEAYRVAYRQLLEKIDLAKETPAMREEVQAALKSLAEGDQPAASLAARNPAG